ncbi:hypothetical protein EVAR_29261_1 [Eumeta japonica]|uniref:Uncharacterized protein n=1 Tax=Eumeta variegata TaxID=151549 RepID=A0A4C1VJ47_EUMVA|nr:hypothetical protein EVAR_29261_1 [Eumeta japonica]
MVPNIGIKDFLRPSSDNVNRFDRHAPIIIIRSSVRAAQNSRAAMAARRFRVGCVRSRGSIVSRAGRAAPIVTCVSLYAALRSTSADVRTFSVSRDDHRT